ncbi:MAG: DUF6431 domain-containing protein [Bacteroides thetaiotaomicron]|nr:DUF6431 domain-containing protein [Bacteroides thetaiotaomicron]
MIRLFSVFDKLNHIHFSDRQWFDLEAGVSLPAKQVCPSCGARGCMDSFAQYTRYLVEIQNGHPIVWEVTVKRFRCPSCGHTHAAHPSCLVPYRSYSLRFILYVLRDYFLHRGNVMEICGRYGISPSTLYGWKDLFTVQKTVWLGVLEDMAQKDMGFLDRISAGGMYRFLEKFRFSFLEQMPGRSPEVPLRLPGCPGIPT